MRKRRLDGIPGFSIDRVARAAGTDPDVLRLENLDTDVRPPRAAIEATQQAIERDEDNSYLPFTGRAELRQAVAAHVGGLTGHSYDPDDSVVITCGGTEGLLDALLATTDPGDEVIVTDPTYAGMIYRVRLAGAVPVFVPFQIHDGAWRLDVDALDSAVTERTAALFIMNPSMPSGAVLTDDEWQAIAAICRSRSIWLLYNAAMERILYDGLPYRHPASLPDMAEHTITIGSMSKEYRMIGWRIGWVVGPASIMSDVARVHIYNAVTATGITQMAACAALGAPETDLAACVATWQARRDAVVDQLAGHSMIAAAGGWSHLIDVASLGFDSVTASRRLLELGKIAATPMRHWGRAHGDQYVRLVFSNEPVERLRDLRPRFERALGAP